MAAPAAEEWLNRMTTIHSQIATTLKNINDIRSKLTLQKSRQFDIGDWVLVDRQNLTIKPGNNRSLTQKWIGPYQIVKLIGRHAYKLDLPKGIRIHNVIHTTMLKPFIQCQDDEMHLDDDEQNNLFFDVEQILDSKRVGKTVKYRVRWKVYDQTDDTWEPISSLQNVLHMVRAFHTMKPRAPRNPSV